MKNETYGYIFDTRIKIFRYNIYFYLCVSKYKKKIYIYFRIFRNIHKNAYLSSTLNGLFSFLFIAVYIQNIFEMCA